MVTSEQFLYLSDADVSTLQLDPGSVRAAIHEAFRLYGEGALLTQPKTSIPMGPGHAFQSLAVVDTRRNFAALKWIGMIPPGGAAAVNINATLLLSDARTGQLRCVMDARRATALRTAGMSAVAGQYLARRDSVSIGFVGGGVQAESHLAAFSDLLPTLRTVYVNSRTPQSAQGFAERVRALGFEAIVATVEETVSCSNVVVTTVPIGPDFQPFIEARWVRPGASVLAVDLARSWRHEGLAEMDVTIVDEEFLKAYAKTSTLVPDLDQAQGTLADLVCGRRAGRTDGTERTMLVSSGSAVADLAIAVLMYDRAQAQGVGTRLAL